MKKYLKLNDRNWRRLCKKEIKAEQQEIKITDKQQIKFNLIKEK